MDQNSMYLAEKEKFIPGANQPDISVDTVEKNGTSYENSIKVKNMLPVSFELRGGYRTLTGKAAVEHPQETADGVIFKVYGDGTLLYKSEAVTDGTADVLANVSGVRNLTLCAEDAKSGDTVVPCWLSPYITAGTEPTDESELYHNLAKGKTVSATTTAASEGVSPESAVDGDDLTCWESSETVTEGRPQSLPVDLGKTYDIRNARVGMKYDYLLSSYTISTSADGNTWSEQVRNSKTAHSSNILDRFAAEGVRYVKVEFTDVKSTQGESGGSEPHAFITEFEVYQDKGVETVADYNLAGLDVAGEDLVFSASKTEYSLTEQGDGSEIFLRAYPANKNSQVSVNGTVLKTGAADSMEELSYIKAVPDAQGRITVEVVSFDGKGTKHFASLRGKTCKSTCFFRDNRL